MKIEKLYHNWQCALSDVETAENNLAAAKRDALRQEQKLLNAVYDKRDSLKHYGEQMIQSGECVFSFDFTGKQGGGRSIEGFKLVKFPSLDD